MIKCLLWCVLLVAPLALSACGGSKTAAPVAPKATSTTAHQVVVQQTLPSNPSSKRLPMPTSAAPGHGKLPTVPPALTPSPIPSSAYTAVIFGTVVDKTSGSPVPGAIVTIASGGKHVGRTDAFGAYSFAFPASVAAPVTVSATGFAPTLAMGRLLPREKLRLDFKLVRAVHGKPVIPPFPTTFGH